MRRAAHPAPFFAALLTLAMLAGCGAGEMPAPPQREPAPSPVPFVADESPQSAPGEKEAASSAPRRSPAGSGAQSAAGQKEESMLNVTVGDRTLTAVLEDNPSARALEALLEEGPVTIPAENYGGFEKVGALPEALPRDDVQTTACPGDVMLYQGDNIVIFYGSNRWAYTRLARIAHTDGLEEALGGSETTLTLSLEP